MREVGLGFVEASKPFTGFLKLADAEAARAEAAYAEARAPQPNTPLSVETVSAIRPHPPARPIIAGGPRRGDA